MNRIQDKWLAAFPWREVAGLNQKFCQEHEVAHQLKASAGKAQALWETKGGLNQPLPLAEAIELCHQCQNLSPFEFYNAKTFATIGASLLEPGLNRFPPPEARIIRNSVSHYIADQISRREMDDVLKHFTALWKEKAADTGPSLPPKLTPQPLPPRPGE